MNIEKEPRFTFIDLFAGIGGFRLAFEKFEGQCLFASEWDKHAALTYQANFGHFPEGNITEIKSRDIPIHDVLTAGFPCQPFSIAGVSKHNSLGNEHGFRHKTQGTLFFEVARIIEDLRPKAFVLENVKNLVSHDKGKTYRTIQTTLHKELEYEVFPYILDAKSLVPQHRERVYLIGFRKDVDTSTFKPPVLQDNNPRLLDILDEKVDARYTLSDNLWTYLKNYAAKHRAKGNGFGYSLADPKGITRTLSARYHKDGSEILIAQDSKNPRRLTPRECSRLMGFPKGFIITVSDTQAYRQFGNSVVVPVVECVAERVIECIFAQENQQLWQSDIHSMLIPGRDSIPEIWSAGVH